MKKLVVGVALGSFALIGMVAALPVILPMWTDYQPNPGGPIDSAMRQQAVAALAANVTEHYVFPDKATAIASLLNQRLRNGDYDAIADGDKLAKALTADMASIAHDLHMRVEFSRGVLPPEPPRTPRASAPQGPFFMQWIDALGRKFAKFGVEKAERLPSNIGYLELSTVRSPEYAGEKFAAAMDKLADTNALIIDLRGTAGGAPDGVALLTSYFVDQRTRVNDVYSRATGLTRQYWTDDKLAGKRYGAQKKIAILIGPNTHSGGEDFAYTMQALKRATLIGARTWGGAHPIHPFRLTDHFVGLIPHERSISPITHTNWEGSGVLPDITAAPADGMRVATAYLLRSELNNAGVRPMLPAQ